jgi:hypothetical protein
LKVQKVREATVSEAADRLMMAAAAIVLAGSVAMVAQVGMQR